VAKNSFLIVFVIFDGVVLLYVIDCRDRSLDLSGVCSCIVGPLFSLSSFKTYTGSIFSSEAAAVLKTPPSNSTFVDGWLVDGPRDICGGIGDLRAPNTDAISLCQSFAFNAAVGNLMFFITSIPTLHGLTLPATLMILALPFREYILALVAPALGICIQVYVFTEEIDLTSASANLILEQGETGLVRQQYVGLYILVYALVIYGTCITAALTSERYNRSLFVIQSALSEQREALVTERDETQYVDLQWRQPLQNFAFTIPLVFFLRLSDIATSSSRIEKRLAMTVGVDLVCGQPLYTVNRHRVAMALSTSKQDQDQAQGRLC